jgi:phosphoribosylformylglycinamidine synthase II
MNQTLVAILTPSEHHGLLYWIHYSGNPVPESDLDGLRALLSDEVDQDFFVGIPAVSAALPRFRGVAFKDGVTDNSAQAVSELLRNHVLFQGRTIQVQSAELQPTEMQPGRQERGERPRIPCNPLIQYEFTELQERPLPRGDADGASSQLVRRHEFTKDGQKMSAEALVALSKQNQWALSQAEMQIVQAHFGERPVTDVEIEMIAQTWSEHCKHKIFQAEIEVLDESGKYERTVKGLFGTYIKGPTDELMQKKSWLVSVFKDNAGIVRFTDGLDLSIKVETHNSPSALDPYGGALTGILGVNRDILGTGIGARPIANTNVLCFGYPDEASPLPEGLFHPAEVLRGVHKGIQDGGNKSGIPTVNGAILFDDTFAGKPLVYCGTVGVAPSELNGRPTARKGQQAGDCIVMVGGNVGLDGIHGATSSSLEMTVETPSSMVQIGDPLTQKRVMDFILMARDLDLYSSITDNGAGGLSSSIGEMCEQTGGAEVHLDRVPLKQKGLKPWQIWVSESQERMTVAVPPAKLEAFLALSGSCGVSSTNLGTFTSDGRIRCLYRGETVLDLSVEFLHQGLPRMKLQARAGTRSLASGWKPSRTETQKPAPRTVFEALSEMVLDPNLASKERWVRQYDHEVQAATAVKPFEGVYGEGAPNEGGVIALAPHGAREAGVGCAVGSGIASKYMHFGARVMAQIATDEAVRNVVCTGADPEKIALVDNFCWPDPVQSASNPDGALKLRELVDTCEALAELVRTYEMPLISGKDSMKNDYSRGGVKISVLPTLLVTALGHVPDVSRALKPHARSGQKLYLLTAGSGTRLPDQGAGLRDDGYFGVIFRDRPGLAQRRALRGFDPARTRKLYQGFHEAWKRGLISAAHDVSEGGALFAAFEMTLLRRLGIQLKGEADDLAFWCSEDPGQILVAIAPEHEGSLRSCLQGFEMRELGAFDDSGTLGFIYGQSGGPSQPLAPLRARYREVL